MTEMICPRAGCNNKAIQIYIFDWKFGSPARQIEIRCPKCGLEVFYDLKLAQNEVLDRIDE